MGKNKGFRIAHLIASNFYGGPEKQIIEHLKRLDASRYSGMVFSFAEDSRETQILSEARKAMIECRGVEMAGPFDLAGWARLRKAIALSSLDLLCVHGYKSTVMGLWVQKTLKVPTLAFSRGYTAENKKVAFYQLLDRIALRFVDGVVCVSEGQKRRLAELGVRPKRTWVVHNAVATPDDSPSDIRPRIIAKFDLPDNIVLCVSAGRLSPEKGHEDLIEAIALMGERANNCIFLICGDGPCMTRLKNRARILGIEEKIRFIGFRKDIQDIFRAMDILILPSHSEGLPNVVLEAFSLCKAVIATSVGGVPELVAHGRNGILVPPKDPAVLADAIARCIGDPAMREDLGKAARSTVQNRFSFEDQSQKLESIYAAVLTSQ